MMLTLTEDITSHTRKTIYGFKNDSVELIAMHGEVAIVKGTTGRFPVHISKTSDSGSKNLQSQQPERCHTHSKPLQPDTGRKGKSKTIVPVKTYSEPLPQKTHTAPTLF